MRGENEALQPVRAQPAHVLVAERLRRSIALGEVLPGERLPAERTLARDLSVSRLTVREALRVLQAEGVIVTRRGGAGGAFVTERTPSVARLRAALAKRRPSVEEIFEFRLSVETAAARLAALRRTDEDVAALAGQVRALEESDGAGAFRRADSAFHLAVAEASANPMLARATADARAALFEAFDVLPFQVRRDTSAAGHAAIVEAVRARDGEAAAAAMAEHLRRARDEVLAVLRGSA